MSLNFVGVAAGILVLISTWLIIRAVLVLVRKFTFAKYWNKQLQLPVSPKAITLVVLGNSVAQGVGASKPQKTLVGRAVSYITQKTNRPVHIANYSRSGATAHDIIDSQLPNAKLAEADIILVEVGVNDSNRRTVEEFEADMKTILAALPLEKTIIADVPYPKLRPKYQETASGLLTERAVHCAYPSKVFIELSHDVFVTAGDFFHPNDKGYALWFEAFRPGIEKILKLYYR